MHTFEQISAFVAVYEHGSYSNAAKQLNKSRTTVREHVMTYEDLLGYDLFTIQGRKATPTDNATHLYRRAKLVEKQNRSLFTQSQILFDHDVHTVNICYDVMTPLALLAYLDHQLVKNHPEISEIGRASCRERVCQYV